MLPSPVLATLTVAELAAVVGFGFAVAVSLLLPQPAATSATSGTSTAVVRRPRVLARVMLAPLRSGKVVAHPGREPRGFRRRVGDSFACHPRSAPNRSCRLTVVGATAASRPTTDASARRTLSGMAHNEHVIYTANAHVTGGRAAGHGRTSDGALEVDLRAPLERGGEGGGTNPEQLFAIGYAACFESALATAARRRRIDVADVAIDASVSLIPTESRVYALAVTLAVTLPSVEDAVDAVELVRAAHQICPYSNATRGNIDVVLTANGRAVEPAESAAAGR